MDDDMISTEESTVVDQPEGEITEDAASTEVEVPQLEQPVAPLQIDPLAELEKLTALDPKVREALKAGYLRQADYTKKTQEIAEARRLYEQSQEARTAKTEETPKAPEDFDYPDEPAAFGRTVEERAVNKALEIMRNEIKAEREQMQSQQQFETDVNESSKLDPRLTTDEVFAKQIAGLVQVNFGQDVKEGKMSVTEATQKALEAHKQYEESMRQRLLDEMNAKAKEKSTVIPSSKGSPLTTASNKGGRMDMQQAAKLAEDELNSR